MKKKTSVELNAISKEHLCELDGKEEEIVATVDGPEERHFPVFSGMLRKSLFGLSFLLFLVAGFMHTCKFKTLTSIKDLELRWY